jgi:hypothetical protein
MSNNHLEKRLSDLESILLKLTEKKPSKLRKFWNWIKPYVIPFILGMMVGNIGQLLPTWFDTRTANKQQAVQGGAAPPFSKWVQPNGSPSPSPSTSLPGNSTTESTASSLTNTSELPSPPSRQADDGQKKSTRLFKRLGR